MARLHYNNKLREKSEFPEHCFREQIEVLREGGSGKTAVSTVLIAGARIVPAMKHGANEDPLSHLPFLYGAQLIFSATAF